MANTMLIKRRRNTAINVSKTTKAMQMISASKLKRAQTAALSARPYVEKLSAISKRVGSMIQTENAHPYLRLATGEKTLLLVIAPDKGLCGGLITNLLKEYFKTMKPDYSLIVVGKKAENAIARQHVNLLASFPFGTTVPVFQSVLPIIDIINDQFLQGKVDKVHILSSKFISLFTQRPAVTQLLPITLSQEETEGQQANEGSILFEPDAATLVPSLFSHYLEMNVYQAMLESFLSEQAARMLAMQNATQNAKDIIEALTLEYNKARQQKITSEILDISSAANAAA